jgi:hypothetical protein
VVKVSDLNPFISPQTHFFLHRFDPHATQFITFNQMSDFIGSLDPPLGIPKPNSLAIVSFDLPIAKGDKIHCLDVLHSLTKYTLGFIEDETEDFAKLTEQMDEKFKKQFPTRKEIEIVSSTREWKKLDTAARVIQKFYRLYIRCGGVQGGIRAGNGLSWERPPARGNWLGPSAVQSSAVQCTLDEGWYNQILGTVR